MNFFYENLGTNTFLVYEVKENDEIDSMSLGMLTNNTIPGFATVAFTQMDETKYIKYNVSSKVSVAQLFSGPVNKKRLLGVFSGIVNAMLTAEDYMLDPQTVILDMDYIYADVSTCETVLLCLPICQEAKPPVDLGMFFKNIIFTTQFDQTENCVHVAQILNYLNSAPALVLEDFKAVLDNLAATGVPQTAPQPVARPAVQPVAQPVAQPAVQPVAQPAVQPVVRPVVQPAIQYAERPAAQPAVQPAAQSVHAQQPGFAIPGVQPAAVQTPTAPQSAADAQAAEVQKPMSAFYLLQHYNKENAALYKEQKERMKQAKQKDKAKKEKAPKGNQSAFNVPGQAPATSFAVPGQAPAAPFAVPGQPGAMHNQQFATQKQPAVQPPMPQQPVIQRSAVQPQVPVQPTVAPQPAAASISFGETVVLGGEMRGTTVLCAEPEAADPKPYLIRLKTNEKVLLNKPTFKLGKEQNYVDYAILGNSAISRSHATIYINNGVFMIEDTNSTNHTYVDGRMIPSNTRTPMPVGCRLRLADEEFEFKMI